MRIDFSSLVEKAQLETGLCDWGSSPALGNLKVLIDALPDASLNSLGEKVLLGRVMGSLKNRLRFNAYVAANQSLLSTTVREPIIIVGPHRSGTTRLHRMLAQDSRFRHLKTWEGMNPGPFTDSDDETRRKHEAQLSLNFRHSTYEKAYAMHSMNVDWAEEEMLLLNHSFWSFSYLGLFNIPQYYEWFMANQGNDEYGDMLRFMQSMHSGGAQWILKNPQHMLNLPSLWATFPDAKFIFIHRDPSKTVGSMLSMACHFSEKHSDLSHRTSIINTWLDFCEQSAKRCQSARKLIPQKQQYDVFYQDMDNDWLTTIRGIYEFVGQPMLDDVAAAMDLWLTASTKEASHHYDLADFGLSDAAISERFGFVRNYQTFTRQACTK